MYNKIKKLKEEYDIATKISIIKGNRLDDYQEDETIENRMLFFKEETMKICFDDNILCNILVDLCYSNSKSKQFVWELCGDIMIKNLLKHRDYKLSFPKQSEDGDFTYKGLTFKMEEVVYEINSK